MDRGGDQRTKDDIAKYGCSVMHVFDPDGDEPPFAYSIGIQRETGEPEVCVIGLKQPLAQFLVNEYNKRIREGERFEIGKYYGDFLEGFEIYIGAVCRSAHDDYFGQCIDFYDGQDFQVVQIIYPTTQGVWPWNSNAPESYLRWQPVLATIDAQARAAAAPDTPRK